MQFFKGQKVKVIHKTKGTFNGVVLRDFETETDDFFPIATAERVEGLATVWEAGDAIPCKRVNCKIKLIKYTLRDRRKEKGLSQTALATLSGVPVRVIRMYEQNERQIENAAAMTVYKLAAALDTTVENLIKEA